MPVLTLAWFSTVDAFFVKGWERYVSGGAFPAGTEVHSVSGSALGKGVGGGGRAFRTFGGSSFAVRTTLQSR